MCLIRPVPAYAANAETRHMPCDMSVPCTLTYAVSAAPENSARPASKWKPAMMCSRSKRYKKIQLGDMTEPHDRTLTSATIKANTRLC